jgi:hypothetical protein
MVQVRLAELPLQVALFAIDFKDSNRWVLLSVSWGSGSFCFETLMGSSMDTA